MARKAGLAMVQTTLASRADAASLAAHAVEARLAACVQIVRIESVYRWEGKVETAEEWRLEAKTTAEGASALAAAIADRHPYDEPEIVMLAVADASEGYAAWVRAAVNGPGG